MGTIRKRGATWRAEVYRKGVRDSGTFPTRQEAADWIAQREVDLIVATTPGKESLVQAIDHFEKMAPRSKADRLRLDALRRQEWARKPLADLTPADIAGWRDERAKVVKASTIRRELTGLRSVLEVARRELKWITVNPVKDVKRPPEPPARKRLISDAERDAMVAALGFDGATVETVKQECAVVFLLALETAMRAGEILALTPADVSYKRRVAVLHTSKTGQGRDVPLSTRAVELLKIAQAKQLLHRRRDRSGRIFHVDGPSLDAIFRRARKDAGLSGFVFHDSRATALTRLAKILQPLDLARMSGHSNLSELLTYYREPAESIAERLG